MKSLKKLLCTSRSLLTLSYVFACSGTNNSGTDSNAVGREAASGGGDSMGASSGGKDTQRTNGIPSTAGGAESNIGGATTTKTATTVSVDGLTAGFGGIDTSKSEPTGGSNSSASGGGTASTTGGTKNANGTSSSVGGTASTTGGTKNAYGTSSSVGGTASTTGGTKSASGVSNTSEVFAFPGAEGFGRLSKGARGGDVYHVTNLDDGGAGSLRDAISVANRTVVFDVGGVINLTSRLIFMNNQTIAGQTAPGDGITLYGDGASFSNANNTIVRYLRFQTS